MAVQQHLGHCGRRAKVAIDLEYIPEPVPQVVPGRLFKDGQQVFMRAFPIGQAREHADGPGPAPTGARTTTGKPELK